MFKFLGSKYASILGLVLNAPVILQCAAAAHGVVIPGLAEISASALVAAQVLGVTLMGCGASVFEKKQ